MDSKTATTDPRTAEQKQLDEAAAAGDWTGFETEELLTEDGALQLLAQGRLLRKARGTDPSAALGSVFNQPFRWKTKVFRVLRCDYAEAEAFVETAPHDDEFVAELKRRVETNRFHHLDYCQGFGFVCFPEDYPNYKG